MTRSKQKRSAHFVRTTIISSVVAIVSMLGIATYVVKDRQDQHIQPNTPFYSITTIWPTHGSELEGVQTFKASVDGLLADNYRLYWTVDNTTWHELPAVSSDAGEKTATIDVSTWQKTEADQRSLTFIAVTPTGEELSRSTMEVKVIVPDAGAAVAETNAAISEQKVSKPQTSSSSAVSIPATNGSKPTADQSLYVDPNNPAKKQADEWRSSRPGDAAIMDKLAAQPQARWFGDWNSNVEGEISSYTGAAANAGKLPVLVLYNIPLRHNTSGGASSSDAYATWIKKVANGIGSRKALIIVEPDALALASNINDVNRAARYKSISDAVNTLKQNSNAIVYIDAGHGSWVGADEMASRLTSANIAKADGFSLNVANFVTTDINVSYGNALSSKLNGRRFVIDTSRNGVGPNGSEWCNPLGRAAGPLPTTNVSHAKVDAYLWIKVLGESDGSCNGGPGAGQWWADYALELMKKAGY